nr:hypothetical protein [Pseudomonas punonensis]
MSAKVVMLHARDSSRALENLNRLTGLRFSRWPESLVATCDEPRVADKVQLAEVEARVEASQVFA